MEQICELVTTTLAAVERYGDYSKLSTLVAWYVQVVMSLFTK
jgi:hypothetical protein